LKESLEYYDELIRKIEKSIKDTASFIGISPGIHESAACVKKSDSIKKMGNPYTRKYYTWQHYE
jgi:hypothetical protein